MKQYLTFALKHNGQYISLGSFSRSNELYIHSYDYAIFKEYSKLTPDTISNILSSLKNAQNVNEETVAKIKGYKDFLAQCNAPFDKKYERFIELEANLCDLKTESDELLYAVQYLDFIQNIIKESDSGKSHIYFKIDTEEAG